MSEILFLSHRIPFPPDKGDKIRSYHLLKALASRYTVHLGTFVDDATDWQHVEAVKELCKGDVCIRPLSPRSAKLKSMAGFFSRQPLTVQYYFDRRLASWVEDLARKRLLSGVFAYSSSMAQYVLSISKDQAGRRVLDFCDVDSDKWRQYVATNRFPMSQVYAREASHLARLEASYVAEFDHSLVISAKEAEILSLIAGNSSRIEVIPNGVDTSHFDPDRAYGNPFDASQRAIVFPGAMDYHANVDAVVWFAKAVMPKIRRNLPDASFQIVGSNPSPAVLELASLPGVRVVGRVPDMRPYLRHAACVVAPLRIARGVQNKVLEALAMSRPVVATSNALQGIPNHEVSGARVVDDEVAMAEAVVTMARRDSSVPQGRAFVLEHFGWKRPMDRVRALFDRADAERDSVAPEAA